ncbi:hypothetical protein [Agitococcus lubricus]|uniref:Uncharacterized protein n=1 Tax=Agitococcus lubricus TaxID=1077255 RepID=A0A2T5J0F3_9GAMM|nr:hypothetical protein [Agitococcus lubricus]PTQ89822.1 hypothetical protein C8N29_105149 [Agitococcus lubricus]
MQIHWRKINDNLIQSDCSNYRIKKLDRGNQVLYAAEIKVSELCYVANWYKLSATEAKQICLDDKIKQQEQAQ